MSTFVQLSEGDPAVTLVTVLEELKGEDLLEARQNVLSHNYAALLQKNFFGLIDLVWAAPEEKVDQACTISFHLLHQLNPEETATLIPVFIEALTANPAQHTSLKLSLLSILFNMTSTSPSVRETVARKVLDLAITTGKASAVSSQLPLFETLMEEEWKMDQNQKISLLVSMYKAATGIQQKAEYLTKYLKAVQGSGDATCAEARPLALEAAVAAIRNPIAEECQKLLSYDAVKSLQTGSPLQKQAFSILSLYATSDCVGYRQFIDQNQAVLQELKLDAPDNLLKIRRLALLALFSTRSEVSYDEVLEKLSLSEDVEVEQAVIAAVRAGEMDAVIDDGARMVIIGRRATQFSQGSWEDLQGRLGQWLTALNAVSSVSAERD